MLSGSFLAMGLPYNEVPGDSHENKTSFLKGMSEQQLESLLQKPRAFKVHVKKGRVFCAPPSTLMRWRAGQAIDAVRWGTLKENLPERAYIEAASAVEAAGLDGAQLTLAHYLKRNAAQLCA